MVFPSIPPAVGPEVLRSSDSGLCGSLSGSPIESKTLAKLRRPDGVDLPGIPSKSSDVAAASAPARIWSGSAR